MDDSLGGESQRMTRTYYYVKYGQVPRIGRFSGVDAIERGERVIVRSPRGTELGRVLGTVAVSSETSETSPKPTPPPNEAIILRAATPDDLGLAHRASTEGSARFQACLRMFEEAVWPIQMIDVEPLLDEGRTILYYLGPHNLDFEGLQTALRDRFGLDVQFEPLGVDAQDPPETEIPSHSGCGSEGGSCGTGGGCGTGSRGGCSTCGSHAAP